MKKNLIFLTLMLILDGPFSTLAHAEPPNFHQVTNGVFRGGRPTLADLDELKRQGFKTIINVEDNEKYVAREIEHGEKIGLDVKTFPMSVWETPSAAMIEIIHLILQTRSMQPVYLHCKHGRDRTGLVFGLFRYHVQNWSAEDAYREMLDLGFRPRYFMLDNYFRQITDYRGRHAFFSKIELQTQRNDLAAH